MTRTRILSGIGIAVAAVALGWVVMTTLSRVLRQTDPVVADEALQEQTTPSETPAVPRIKATLYFGSEDGHHLVGVEQEIPLAEGTVAQARAIVEAQIQTAAPAPLARTIPEGTGLRGVYVSDRNEAFVDLDATFRDKHPGGSLNELFTIYTIVNAITTNLADVQAVQVLIDGREVDTLAGHVDLRRPLRKNDLLTTP
jgi:Sporulation and spore germination